ncbi:hypothetical protein MMC30_002474 [Trapelia coarctata]|nr:hypothetical protein [Trapelia coarctata]
MVSPILLRGGTLLVHNNDNHVSSLAADLLVEGNTIVKIEKDISIDPASNTRIIDCTNKIVTPGYIDTHHHLWQTQLKGRHGDHSVLDYMPTGNLACSFFTPGDIFWGQLAGALEALDSGTTTVVDHAHLNYSEEHTNQALSATLTSGLRSIFCYTPTPLVQSWSPTLSLSYNILPSWLTPHLTAIGAHLASNPRVTLGFAFDAYALLSPEATTNLFASARAAGARLFTSHYAVNPILGSTSVAQALSALGLLDGQTLLAHAAGASAEDATLVAQSGAHVSCTPACELQQGLGAPAAWAHPEWRGKVSLGVDSHSVVRGGMAEQMRLALQYARGTRTVSLLHHGGFPAQVRPTVEEVFNMATVDGATAIGMGAEVGRLQVGFRADVVVWGTESPGMVCAGAEDALAAVVGFAGVRDVECVLVDGAVRKEGGRLVACRRERVVLGNELHHQGSSAPAGLHGDGRPGKTPRDGVVDGLADGTDSLVLHGEARGDRYYQPVPETGVRLEWADVAREVQRSRREIAARMQAGRFDAARAREEFMAAFLLDRSVLVD